FDAVKLFVDRAERLSTRFVAAGSTLEAIAELTRRVEGMPLALELAATWTRSVTVDELLAELAEDIGRLAADLRDLPERQRSIRTVLDYSWRSLTPEEQRSLARLTVFRGGFTLAAAEKVTGVHAALLYGLGAHSLVSRGADGRFRVHELVRQFAAERLTEAEAKVIRAAHSRHYLSEVAERLRVSGSAERAAVIRELFDELDNVRFALEHAVESFDTGLLEAALPPLFSLHLEAGALADITSVLEGLAAELEARAAAGPGRVETERAAEDEPLRLVVTQQLGRAYMAHGYFAAAVDKLEPLVPVLRDAAAGGRRNVTEALARALDWLG